MHRIISLDHPIGGRNEYLICVEILERIEAPIECKEFFIHED
jgi:hypothetical protein